MSANKDVVDAHQVANQNPDANQVANQKDTPTLMCTRAAAIRARYSFGISRIPFEDLGVSPMNRSVSYKHAH